MEQEAGVALDAPDCRAELVQVVLQEGEAMAAAGTK